MDDVVVNSRLTIPGSEVRVSFSRAGGPGGQHVNKTETRVEMRWCPADSAALTPTDRSRLIARLGSRLTASGDLVVAAGNHRSQARNRDEARSRLADLVRAAITPAKRRVRTRPSRGVVERRLESKRRRSQKKRDRRWRGDS